MERLDTEYWMPDKGKYLRLEELGLGIDILKRGEALSKMIPRNQKISDDYFPTFLQAFATELQFEFAQMAYEKQILLICEVPFL